MKMQMLSRAEYMKLLNKYKNLYAMYVEYPHKSLWTPEFSGAAYAAAIEEHILKSSNAPLLLYIHIPFCKLQCYYCTCHTVITSNYDRVRQYLELLYAEMDLLKAVFDKHGVKPNIKEIHLGGGSPTILKIEDFDKLIDKLGSITDLSSVKEFTIEVDPRSVSTDTLKYYHSKGLNRLSFGVQEFNPEVQKAINRVQPAALVESLLTPEIRGLFHGINFDFMWGLPKQTRASYKESLETLLRIAPDRISLLLLHFAPKLKKHQLMMKESDLPDLYERTLMFHDAVEQLTGNGYVRIGLEHFAKPDDDLSKALKAGTAAWNSLGYTAGRYFNVIGIGTGSSGTIADNYYFQNTYELPEYEKLLKAGLLPAFRGYKLNNDDVIRRELIQKMRIYFRLDFKYFEDKYKIVFAEYFSAELKALNEFVKDGILELGKGHLEVTELGKFFTMQICRTFDKYGNN